MATDFKLTPDEILGLNKQISSSIGNPFDLPFLHQSQRGQAALDKALEPEEPEEEGGGGFLDAFLGGPGGAVIKAAGKAAGAVGSALDMARAGTVAAGVELGDLIGGVVGVETAGGDASLRDLRENFNRRIGVGDVLEENTLTTGLPLNVKRGVGLAGDIAVDPLNAVLLGPGTAAKGALKTVARAEGDDIARIAATKGVPAADRELVKKALAEAEPAARRQIFATGPNAGRRAPVVAAANRPSTIESILAQEGFDERAASRAIRAIETRGAGGIQFAGRTLVEGETLRPLTKPLSALGRGFKQSGTGKSLRKGLVPFTESRDKFGEGVAEFLPRIAHRQVSSVGRATAELNRRIVPLAKKVNSQDSRNRIIAALDVNGLSVSDTLTALREEGLLDTAALLEELRDTTYRTYDDMLSAGFKQENLLPRDEYIRHTLTDEGAEMIGLDLSDLARDSPGTKSGRLGERTRPDSILDQNQDFGIAGYVSDPAKLVASSGIYAQEVLGNKRAWEELAKLGRETGQKLTSTEARKGFTQVAPDAFVDNTIYRNMFEMGKSGTQSSLVRSFDEVSSLIKRHTLFNVISFGPYFTQNMATGLGMNIVGNGVGPKHWRMSFKVHRAIKEGLDEVGEQGLDGFLTSRLTPDESRMANLLRKENVFPPDGFTIYDDVARARSLQFADESLIDKLKVFGTNRTTKINSYGEQQLRGSLFIKAMLEDGLSSGAAADLVTKTHIDYSAIGRTAFERNAINRFVFFPTWLMRAPAAIVRTYAERPGLAMGQARLEMGTHFFDRERNEFDELKGPRLSGPLSFLTGAGAEGLGALRDPLSIANPLVRAALDPESRELREVVPPLSNVLGGDFNVEGAEPGRQDLRSPNEVGRPGRLQGVLDDPLRRQIFLASLLGVRTGLDRGAIRDEDRLSEAVAEREAADQDPTTTQLLKILASERGIEEAAGMTQSEVAKALLESGVTREDLARIFGGGG